MRSLQGILCAAVLSSAAFIPSLHAQPRFGLEAGANVGQLGSDTILGDGRYWKWGGGLAVLSQWSVAPGWTIEAAPGWERQTRRGTQSVVAAVIGTYPSDHSVRFDRLVLPVRATWRPAARGLSIEAGGGPAWLARAEHRNESSAIDASPAAMSAARGGHATPDAQIFEEVGTVNRTDWTDNFHRWDAVVSLGAGWDMPAGAATLRVRTRWQQGLFDFSKYGEPVRLSSGALSFGLLW